MENNSVSGKFGGFEETQVFFVEFNYNEVVHWHILLIGITITIQFYKSLLSNR